MIDATTQALIQDILRREGRSLLQYVGEAFPWATQEEGEALEQLQKLTAEERDTTATLARFLQRRRVTPPYLGAYPMAFTSLGFVSLDYLLPRLVDQQRQAIARLEKDLPQLHDREAKALMDTILEMKRGHLKTLEELATTHPQPVAH